jgi:hypothetical protein
MGPPAVSGEKMHETWQEMKRHKKTENNADPPQDHMGCQESKRSVVALQPFADEVEQFVSREVRPVGRERSIILRKYLNDTRNLPD